MNDIRCLFVGLILLGVLKTGYSEKSCSCNNKWKLVATTNETGNVTQGSKTELIQAVLNGAELRIQLASSGYLTSVQNIQVLNDNVCVQALFHISKASYDAFQENAYWWFLYVCSSGRTNIARYYVGEYVSAGRSEVDYAIKWFIRPMQNVALEQTGENSVMSGNIVDLINDVESGSDVRIVSSRNGYSVEMDSVEVSTDRSLVVGQSVFYISTTVDDASNYKFENNSYWWFTNWATDSTVHASFWNIGEHVSRGNNVYKFPIKWYTESCWQLAYQHDASGNQVQGSLEFLRSAIKAGHRLKIVYGDRTSVEPDDINIRNGHVTAFIFRMIGKNPQNIKAFDNGVWDWRMITTTGTETTLKVNYGEYIEQGRSNSNIEAKWFVDTRHWKQVLVNSNTGSIISGSKSDLIEAINAGSRVRYLLEFPGKDTVAIKEADNLAISGNNVGAMHVRSVSKGSAHGNNYEYRFAVEPYFYFTISSTTGKVDMSRWTVGNHQNRGHSNSQAKIKWFVN
ncbi:hypothetical protein ACF0H5_019094 [Mactra antiquata]